MTRVTRLILGVIAAGVVSWLVWSSVGSFYFDHRSELEGDIEQLHVDIRLCEKGLRDRSRVDSALEAFVDRTLGGELETVDHRLRSRLNRIGESLGLNGLTVGTSRSRSMGSPARAAFSARTQKALRDEVDFVELEGSVTGRGSLEQALRLVHRIEAEPWPKRLHDVRIDPKEGGRAYDINVRFVTIFVPGAAPAEIPEPIDDDGPLVAGQGVLARDPFRLPAASPGPKEPKPAKPAKPPAFPYHQWVLTGVVAGPGGHEAWLRNAETGRTLNLSVGGAIGEFVLVSVSGESVEFRRGDAVLSLTVGDRLRAP